MAAARSLSTETATLHGPYSPVMTARLGPEPTTHELIRPMPHFRLTPKHPEPSTPTLSSPRQPTDGRHARSAAPIATCPHTDQTVDAPNPPQRSPMSSASMKRVATRPASTNLPYEPIRLRVRRDEPADLPPRQRGYRFRVCANHVARLHWDLPLVDTSGIGPAAHYRIRPSAIVRGHGLMIQISRGGAAAACRLRTLPMTYGFESIGT